MGLLTKLIELKFAGFIIKVLLGIIVLVLIVLGLFYFKILG